MAIGSTALVNLIVILIIGAVVGLYGILTEAQARTTRGHPQFVEPLHAMELSAPPDRTEQVSRTVASARR
jgi:hypothetical protein